MIFLIFNIRNDLNSTYTNVVYNTDNYSFLGKISKLYFLNI